MRTLYIIKAALGVKLSPYVIHGNDSSKKDNFMVALNCRQSSKWQSKSKKMTKQQTIPVPENRSTVARCL